MIKKVKLLISFNLMSYVVNFGFSFFYSYNKSGFKENWGLLGIWAILPYLLLTITSFIFADDYNENYKIFKKEAIIDWLVRGVSFFIVFQEYNFIFLSNKYFIQLGSLIILLLINISFEYIMYIKARKYDKNINIYNKKNSFIYEQKGDINNIAKASTIGAGSIIIYSCFGISIAQTYNVESAIARVIAISVSLTVFLWFLYVNHKKCMLFYSDKKLGKNIFIRDSIYASIGYFINFISIFGVYNGSKMESYILFLGIILLYPMITTSRRIAITYKQISGC